LRINEHAIRSATHDGTNAEALAVSGHVGDGDRWSLVAARAVEDADGDGSEAGLEGRSGIDANGGDEKREKGVGLHFESVEKAVKGWSQEKAVLLELEWSEDEWCSKY
jgi:hypothetical protein